MRINKSEARCQIGERKGKKEEWVEKVGLFFEEQRKKFDKKKADRAHEQVSRSQVSQTSSLVGALATSNFEAMNTRYVNSPRIAILFQTTAANVLEGECYPPGHMMTALS